MNVMNRVFRIIFISAILTGLLTLAACSDNNGPPVIDKPAPNFKLKDINGQSVSLSDFKGKVVFINFWDTTFEYCTDDIAHLQELHDEWSLAGEIVLLTIDADEDAETIQAFMQKNNYNFPVLLDSEYVVAGKYNVKYVPTSLLIDREGNFKLKVEGPFRYKSAIEKQLAAYLP